MMGLSLIIAIGNPLRRDDGVAYQVAKALPRRAGLQRRKVLQLTPEIAAEISAYRTVVFVDADSSVGAACVAPVAPVPAPSPLTHASTPAEIVALARVLFGFTGRAYVCHVPITDLSPGAGLSPLAQQFAKQAAREIEHIMGA
jgi:hydrogenase maturation protease